MRQQPFLQAKEVAQPEHLQATPPQTATHDRARGSRGQPSLELDRGGHPDEEQEQARGNAARDFDGCVRRAGLGSGKQPGIHAMRHHHEHHRCGRICPRRHPFPIEQFIEAVGGGTRNKRWSRRRKPRLGSSPCRQFTRPPASRNGSRRPEFPGPVPPSALPLVHSGGAPRRCHRSRLRIPSARANLTEKWVTVADLYGNGPTRRSKSSRARSAGTSPAASATPRHLAVVRIGRTRSESPKPRAAMTTGAWRTLSKNVGNIFPFPSSYPR